MDSSDVQALADAAGRAARDAAYDVIRAAFDSSAFPDGPATLFAVWLQRDVAIMSVRLINAKLARDGAKPGA
jgi:hypothetical protein